MKITEPNYYKEFQCTAQDCSYHCCQQWRIGVEEEVVQRWKKTAIPEVMRCDGAVLFDCVKEDDGYYICHRENGVCPFIDEVGLCNVIKTYSDQMTPRACQQFPREIHQFADAQERSLSVGCPVALDLLLAQETFQLDRYEKNSDTIEAYEGLSKAELDSETHREMLEVLRDWYLSIVQSSNCSVSVALRVLFYLSLHIYDTENELGCDFDIDMLNALQDQTDVGEMITYMENLEKNRKYNEVCQERNELFLDIVGNYYQQGMYVEFLEPLIRMAQQWEKLEQNVTSASIFEYEKWLQLLVCQELSGVVVANEQQTMYDVIVKLQWLALEYATLVHWLYLLQCKSGTNPEPKEVKEAIMVLSRIMGYTEEDLFEYMEEAFEEPIWPFGYLNLIV